MKALTIASRNLWRSPGRSSFALVTIVCGIIAFIMSSGFIDWTYTALRDSVIYSSLGHFQISRPGYFEKGIADPYRYLIDAADQQKVEQAVGTRVVTITPRLAISGLVSLGNKTIGFLGEGVDPTEEAQISQQLTIRPGGNDLSRHNEQQLILGEGLAAALGAQVGDTVVLLANKAGGGQNAVEAVVAGIFFTSTKAYDDAYLRLPIGLARQLVQTSGATTLVGLLEHTPDTDRFVDELRHRLPADRFQITPWHAQADFYKKTIALFSRQVAVVRLIIAMIILLSITNTLSMSVIERTSEIGTSLATGARRRDILNQFMTEGALFGAFGGLLGIVLGALMAYLVSGIGIPMPPAPGMAHSFIGRINFSGPIAVDAWLLAMAAALAASILPAWRASRLNIVDALRQGR